MKKKIYLSLFIVVLIIVVIIQLRSKPGNNENNKSVMIDLEKYTAGAGSLNFSSETKVKELVIDTNLDNIYKSAYDSQSKYIYYDIPMTKEEQTLVQDIIYELNSTIPLEFIYGMINTESSFNPSKTGTLDDTGWLQIRKKYYDYYSGIAGIPTEQFSGRDLYCSVKTLVALYESMKSRLTNLDNRELLAYISGSWNYGETRYKKYIVNKTGSYWYSYNKKIIEFMDKLQPIE